MAQHNRAAAVEFGSFSPLVMDTGADGVQPLAARTRRGDETESFEVVIWGVVRGIFKREGSWG